MQAEAWHASGLLVLIIVTYAVLQLTCVPDPLAIMLHIQQEHPFSLIDWISDTRPQGCTDLQSPVKYSKSIPFALENPARMHCQARQGDIPSTACDIQSAVQSSHDRP